MRKTDNELRRGGWSEDWIAALHTLEQKYPGIDWWLEYVGMEGACYAYGQSKDHTIFYTLSRDLETVDYDDLNDGPTVYKTGCMMLFKETYDMDWGDLRSKQLSSKLVEKM